MDHDYPMPQLFTPLSFESAPRAPSSQRHSKEPGGDGEWTDDDDDDSGDSFLLGSPIQLETPGQHNNPMIGNVGKHAFQVAPDYSHASRGSTLQPALGHGHTPAYASPHDNGFQQGGGGLDVHSFSSAPQPRFYPLPHTPESHPASHSSNTSQFEPTPLPQKSVLGARVEKAAGRGRGRPRGRGVFRGRRRGQ